MQTLQSEDDLVAAVNHLILGHPKNYQIGEYRGIYFRSNAYLRSRGGDVDIVLPIEPPILDVERAKPEWKGERLFFHEQARALGVEGFLLCRPPTSSRWEYPEDGDRLVIGAKDISALSNKIDELRESSTGMLDKVRAYALSIILRLPAGAFLLGNASWHPELAREVEEKFSLSSYKGNKDKKREWREAREAYWKELESRPKFAAWTEMVMPFISDNQRTVGDFREFLLNPPEGRQEVCAAIRAHIIDKLPLLAMQFEKPLNPSVKLGVLEATKSIGPI